MNAYRRPENKLESLLRWRRNVFLQLPGGGYVLVSATRYMLTLHHFSGSVRGEPSHTEHLDVIPGLFDGNGWNLALLGSIESISPQIRKSEKIMPENNQQPFTALYCVPMRDSISKMTGNELKIFLALATRADEQGVCFPGVRTLAEDTGLQPAEISAGLQSLSEKRFLYYLRRAAIDSITRKLLPDVYGLNTTILRAKTDSGFQTYMHEFLSQVFPSNPAQPESPESKPRIQNQKAAPITTTTNHHQNQTSASEGGDASASGNDQTNAHDTLTRSAPSATTPVARPKPAQSAIQNNPPGSAPPPLDAGSLEPYAVPLPDAANEAYANEMRELVGGLQLAKARQLVAVYGVNTCGIAMRLLAKQPFHSVSNQAGWLINKLRQNALLPVDGTAADVRTPEERGDAYVNNQWSDFIEH